MRAANGKLEERESDVAICYTEYMDRLWTGGCGQLGAESDFALYYI